MIVLSVLLYGCAPSDVECDSKDCFVSKAKECGTAQLEVTEDIGIIKYETDGCTFKKTIVTLDDTEEMKALLEGKSLTCSYEEFNQEWMDSLVEDIEDCDGELKEIIGKLVLFV
jgi:hypothetical protein